MSDAAGCGRRSGWAPAGGRSTNLVLVRHGSTVHSPAGRFSGRNNLSLNDSGRKQASQLARYMRRLTPVNAIVSSPLRRARETAEAIAVEYDLAVETHPGLIEADFGEWEGLTFDEAKASWPDELDAWLNRADAAPPGGESWEAMTTRVENAVAEIVTAYPGEAVALVSHLGPIKTLLRRALGAPYDAMFRFRLDTASLSIIEYYDGATCYVQTVNNVGICE